MGVRRSNVFAAIDRMGTATNNRLAVMLGSRLQMSQGITLSMESLIAPSNPTFPQLCVDPLDPFCFPAFPFAGWPRVRVVRTHIWYVRARDVISTPLCAALPFRVGPVRALVHGSGVSGSGLSGDLHHLMIYFTPRRRRFELTVDLAFFRPLLVDGRAVPGMSIPQSASEDTTIRVA